MNKVNMSSTTLYNNVQHIFPTPTLKICCLSLNHAITIARKVILTIFGRFQVINIDCKYKYPLY